jgi:hypothetical protein
MGHNYVKKTFQLHNITRSSALDLQLREWNLLTERGTHSKAS